MTGVARTRHGRLRGALRLATDATAGLASLVEAVHARIARVPLGAAPERTRGITGLVYRSIRGVTRGVGGGADALLALLDRDLHAADAPPGSDALIAALNGVLGDHLDATGNPLATPMVFRHAGRTLPDDAKALAAALPDARPALLLTVHGLCLDERCWQRGGHDPATALAHDLGFTPVALRYNSGRHVHENGRDLAQRLQALAAAWPVPLQRIAIVGHSMGGLVARSAVAQAQQAQQAQQAGLDWPGRLSDLIFLGTPHHGAPLERAGHGVDLLLGAMPYAAPLARLGRLRSAGITDLRHGTLLADARTPAPLLPAGVRCRALAGALGDGQGALDRRLLGDGLVTVDSALGRHRDPARRLGFGTDATCVLPGVGHLALLGDAAAWACVRRWLSADAAPAAPALRR